MSHAEWLIGSVLAVGLAVVIALVVVSDREDRATWEAFRVEHKCRIVGHQDDKTLTGFGLSSSGKSVVTTSYIPAQAGWLCDDGITYWRDAE